MSLKQELQKRLLNDMISKSRGDDKALVLVVDPHTSKILSSCCRMYDIMQAGVIVLQNVLLKREKLDLPAIYFIEPVTSVVEAVINDFEGKKSQYASAHLFFTSRVKSEVMKQIGSSKKLVKKIKSFVELNVDFLAIESRVFSFDRFHTIPRLYFPSSLSSAPSSPEESTTITGAELIRLSRHLVSVCLTMSEYPYVRYVSSSGLCKSLASIFEDEMKKTITKLPDWKYNENRERGTLLIVDRSMDAVAPLMHEYTFQAMVTDLLKVRGEICEVDPGTNSSKKNAAGAGGGSSSGDEKADSSTSSNEEDRSDRQLVLSEDDSLWVDFRHRHIGDVMHIVTEKFREFKGQNKLAQLQTGEEASVKDMLQAMRDMPEYKSMMKKYHKHMSLAQQCMGRFESKRLKELGELEQDMATGLTNDGKTVIVKTLKSQLVKMCQDNTVGVLEKLRLLMIYIISQGGIQDSTRKELMKNIHISLQKAIRNLEKLGVDLSTMQSNKPKHTKERMAEFAKRNKTIPLALMRYLPHLHTVIEQLVSYELDDESFPYVTPPPEGQRASMAGKGGKSARKKPTGGDWKTETKEKESEEDKKPRFIVFVIGGVTCSELRSSYEIADSSKANVYIGSSCVLSASEYIRDLSDMTKREFREALLESGDQQAAQNEDSDQEEEGQVTDDLRQIQIQDK